MSSRKNRSPEEQARRAKIRELLQESNISSMEDIQNLLNIPAAGNRHSGKTETANPAQGNRWSGEMETIIPVGGSRLCEA